MKIKHFIHQESYCLSIRSETQEEAQLLAGLTSFLKSGSVLDPQIRLDSSGKGYKNIEISFFDITKTKYDEISDLCIPGIPASFADLQKHAQEYEHAKKAEAKQSMEKSCNTNLQVSVIHENSNNF